MGPRRLRWVSAVVFVFGAGCGGDDAASDASSSPDRGADGDVAGDAADDANAEPSERWYVQTTVATPDGRTSYLQTLSSIEGLQLTTDRALELSGNARVFGRPSGLYTGSAESPILQRWFPQRDGTLEPGERLSLASLGLAFIPFGNNFISEDKAYLFDGFGGPRAIVWNPETLELRGEIDLSTVLKDGFVPDLDPGVLRGDLLFAVVQQQDFAGDFNRGIQVVVFDTTNDTIAAVIEDDRCVGNFSGLVQADDGSIYVMGDNYLLRQWFDDSLPPSCILRIPPDAMEFDPDFFFDLDGIVGGFPCTGLFYLRDGVFLTTAMDESLGTVDPREAPLTFLNEMVATWWEIDVENPGASRPLTELGRVSPRTGAGFVVAERQFIQRPEAGFTGENALIEVDRAGEFREVFEATGLITALGRVEVEP